LVRAFSHNVYANIVAGGTLVLAGWLVHQLVHGLGWWIWTLILVCGLAAIVLGLLRLVRRVPTRVARSAMQTELKSCLVTIDRAIASGYWWDTQYVGLPAHAWTSYHSVIAQDASGKGRLIHDACQNAYVAADQLNKICNQLTIRGAQLGAAELSLIEQGRTRIALAVEHLGEGLAS